jgi:hypothetical protein
VYVRFIFILALPAFFLGCETPMQPKHTPTGPVANSSSQLNAFGNAGVGAEAQSDTTNSSANDIGASPGTNDASLFWDYGLND